MSLTKPKTLDVVVCVGFLALGMWNLANGDVVVGAGFTVLGVLALAAGSIKRVHDFMYRPIWQRDRK
jgi:hypothetical protein